MTDEERSSKLKELEELQDIATLAFWEAIEARDVANANFDRANHNMVIAKGNYLRFKIRGELWDAKTSSMSYAE